MSGSTVETILSYALVSVTAVVFVETVRAWFGQAWRSYVARRRAKAWQRGERRAFWLIEAQGYRVIDRQVSKQIAVSCGGERREFTLRADYLAERDDKHYIAEVKTGRAPDLGNSATRRQLLEYLVAYDVDGVLLVDADAGTVHEVVFEALSEEGEADEPTRGRLPWYVVAAGASATAMLFAML